MGDYAGSAYIYQASPPLPPTITQQPQNSLVCYGSSASFSIIAVNATSYQWKLNGANIADTGFYSGTNTANLSISETNNFYEGNYICVASNSSGSTSSNSASLTLEQPVNADFSLSPRVAIYPNSNINFENLSDNNLNYYFWNFGDGETLLQTEFVSNLSHYYNSVDTFVISLTVQNYICDDVHLDTLFILEPDYINNMDNNEFYIYPNPVSKIINISTATDFYFVKILTIDGKNIFNCNLSKNSTIDVSNLKSGIYFLEVKTDFSKKVLNFVKH